MRVFILVATLLIPGFLWADEEMSQAVQAVQQQMKSPEFHQNAAKESPQAQQVEQQVKNLTGSPENEQELYNLAAEVLGNMKSTSPEEMTKVLEEAQHNPEAFANRWTPEQKRKLQELSERLPASQRRNP